MISYLYRTLTDETFEEFRHFYFLISHLQGEGLDIDDGTSCPACPKKEQLRHKFTATEAFYKVLPYDKEVHSFVDSYQSDEVNKEDTMDCSNFQAANTIRSKNKSANLSSKGVFGCACRHGIPRLFLSMRHGERHFPLCVIAEGKDITKQSESELSRICQEFSVTMNTINSWREEAKTILAKKQKTSKKINLSWKESYVKNLDLYHALCLDLALCEDQDQIMLTNSHIRQVHEALAKTEERNGISVRWSQESPEYSDVSRDMQNRSMKAMQEQMRSQAVEYCYLKEISRKYSGYCTEMAKQLKRSAGSLKSSIRGFNNKFASQQSVTFAQVADPSSDFYHLISSDVLSYNQEIPLVVRRKAIDALNLCDRGHERKKIVRTEMKNTLHFYQREQSIIQAEISKLDQGSRSLANMGLKYLLHDKKSYYEQLEENATLQFEQLAVAGYLNIEANELLLSDDDTLED
ncbi:hypothetical protein BSL78_03033 [Apostichopus japonicus]|uniref:Uncharacterized protein n=1 Tax=Stichopus japonicus TaxID=307972 RepID=A0A2G8LIH8_STIJA|nr:hypothetical protein BSL78_03033 [Apostichopus japonicus]